MRVGSSRRMRRLRAALALQDKTLKQWSDEMGVSPIHAHFALRGVRSSARLEAAADELADKLKIPEPPKEPRRRKAAQRKAAR